MKTQLLVVCCLLAPAGGGADPLLTAGDLKKLCASPDATDRSVCSLIVKGYKDGFIEGVATGAFGTYRHDPQVSTAVKDVVAKDFVPRFNKVVEQSTCIQSVQVDDLVQAFSAYVHENPSVQEGPFRTAMFRAIEAKYCRR